MSAAEMHSISELVDAVLKGVRVVTNTEYRIDESLSSEIRSKVRQLCGRFPMR